LPADGDSPEENQVLASVATGAIVAKEMIDWRYNRILASAATEKA
jgi:hypothetical protein